MTLVTLVQHQVDVTEVTPSVADNDTHVKMCVTGVFGDRGIAPKVVFREGQSVRLQHYLGTWRCPLDVTTVHDHGVFLAFVCCLFTLL